MIERYSTKDMARIWSDHNRFNTWNIVEVQYNDILSYYDLILEGEEVENEGWGAVAKAADSSVAKSKAKDVAAKNKKVSSWMKSRKEEALPADAKEAVVRRVKTTVVKPSLKGMPTRQRRLMKAITTSQKKREKEPKHKSGEPLIK